MTYANESFIYIYFILATKTEGFDISIAAKILIKIQSLRDNNATTTRVWSLDHELSYEGSNLCT